MSDNMSLSRILCDEVIAMRTTVNLDDELLAKAQKLTGITGKTAIVNASLKALVERESARALARMGGTMPDIKPIPRRRSEPF